MRGIRDVLNEIATEAAGAGPDAPTEARRSNSPRSACCNADIEIPPHPWFPLCVRCNGLLNRLFQPFPGRHRRGHNERCLWGKGISYGIRLERGKHIAVVFRHSVYDEPDWLALARDAVMTAGREAGMPIGKTAKYSMEFEPHCYIHFIDEERQERDSRGFRFDVIYVMPPAKDVREQMVWALDPNGELKYLEAPDAES